MRLVSTAARVSLLVVAVIATVATPATQQLSISDNAVDDVALADDVIVVERLVRVTVSDVVLEIDGGFLAALRVLVCATAAGGVRACTAADAEAAGVSTPVSLIVDGAPAIDAPGFVDLPLDGLADGEQEVLVTFVRERAIDAAPAAFTLEAFVDVVFPSLDDGSIVEAGDDLPPGATVTVQILPVAQVDTDLDGLSDGAERAFGTDPLDADSDDDALADAAEIDLGTDPLDADTDDDDLTDGDESARGTDPLDADTDGDGERDGAEVACGSSALDPFFVCPDADDDDDGLTDEREAELGTDPNDADSDDDALADGAEVELGTDPRDADSDDDALADGFERERGTDPLDADSDDDGDDDGAEIACGSSPLDAAFTCP